MQGQDDDGDTLLLDILKPKATQSSQRIIDASASQSPTIAAAKGPGIKHTINADDSDTEPEDDDDAEDLLLLPPKDDDKLRTRQRSASPQIDPGRIAGRIIGTTYPLADFQRNVAQGDVVSKAVEDLAWAVQEILRKPFGMRRSEELLTCMKALRDTALQVGF